MRSIALAFALFVALATVSTVGAHAEPVRARPGEGAVLNQPPAQVELIMSQEMARETGANDIDVFTAAGQEVTTAPAVIDSSDRKRLTVALPADLAPGNYLVKWKTLSAEDGDTAEGTLLFTYDPRSQPDPGREELREAPPTPGASDGPPDSGANPQPSFPGGDDDGLPWVVLVAVGVAMFAIGSGATYLFVQRRP